MQSGLFITLEGGEGVGKSTQLRLLRDALQSHGYRVLATREPGGSAGAEDLRQLLLFGKNPLSLRAEILTHFAARFDHVDTVIRPALAEGQIVLCDRFTDSTMAYQGYGRAEGQPAVLDLIAALQAQLGADAGYDLSAAGTKGDHTAEAGRTRGTHRPLRKGR
jgi:dTMP kinase